MYFLIEYAQTQSCQMEKIAKQTRTLIHQQSSKAFEEEYWKKQAYICGVDEVGRGCFFGPVVTAAVILHPYKTHPLLQDSKLLTEKKRVEAAAWIHQNAWVAFGYQTASSIDTHNIYKATQKAMVKAIYTLLSTPSTPVPAHILIDAMPLNIPYYKGALDSFIKGESKSISIAAASIVAKVHRDTLVKRLAHAFPLYTLESHKGYGSQKHRDALSTYGASCMHRNSFLKNIPKVTIKNTYEKQTSFC